MILVHELGHFNRCASLLGVRVDVFFHRLSGPGFFGWKRGATDYPGKPRFRFGAGLRLRMAGQDLSEIDFR